MSLYVAAALVIVCLFAMFFAAFWAFKRGKEAGRKEMEEDVKKWLSKKHKDAYLDLINSGDSAFGSVQNPDAVWGTTPKT